MRLTRRDAILAIGGGALAGYTLHGEPPDAGEGGVVEATSAELEAADLEALVAVAEVVYPSAVDVTGEFVSTYVSRRVPARRRGIREAIGSLDDQAQSWYGARLPSATVGEREALLRRMGVDAVQPRPEGTVSERVRYYVVNGLLYALFTTPKGSRLVGIEEPQGYPGGYAAYRSGGSE